MKTLQNFFQSKPQSEPTEISNSNNFITELTKNEFDRQKNCLNLIASENIPSPKVLELMGSVWSNKYGEGYPGKRYYAGNQFTDELESFVQKKALEVFDTRKRFGNLENLSLNSSSSLSSNNSNINQFLGSTQDYAVNVQVLSGSPANSMVFLSVLDYGDTILSLNLANGGHLSHLHATSNWNKFFKLVNYDVKLVENAENQKPFIIAIDGRGGSGKTTLAKELVEKLPNSVLIERETFLEFMKGMDTTSENWDVKNFELDKNAFEREIAKNQDKDVIILEGLKSFEQKSDLKIWLEIEPKTGQIRAKKRDVKGKVNQIGFAKFWQEYENYAEKYITLSAPKQKADLVISAKDPEYKIKQDWDVSTLQIETERLVLKPVNMDFAEDIFREFTPEITKFMDCKSDDKIEETYEFLERAMREGLAKTDLHLNVFNKENQEFLGMIGLHDLNTSTPEIGIWFKKSAHGNKFGQEVAKNLKIWADEHLNYQNLIYPVDQRNVGSRKVAESLGGILQNKPIENKINKSGYQLEIVEYHIPNPNYQAQTPTENYEILKNFGEENQAILDLVKIILGKSQSSQKPFIIAIDGRSSSGKSTLSVKLEKLLPNSKRFNLDTFDLNGGEFFSSQNIAKNFEIDFENRQFDIAKIQQEIAQNDYKVVILEGAFSFKNLLEIDFDLKIWVELKKEIASERLNNREINERTEIDPKIIRLSTQKWQIAEDRYLQNFKPKQKADLVISTGDEAYEIIVDFSNYLPKVREMYWKIPEFWQENFEEKLTNYSLILQGQSNICFEINHKYILKIQASKFHYGNKDSESEIQKIFDKIKEFSPNFEKLDFVVKIKRFFEKDKTLKANAILMEKIQGQDVAEIFYQLNQAEKDKIFEKSLELLKKLHFSKIQKVQKYDTNKILQAALQEFNQTKNKISQVYQTKVQTVLENYKPKILSQDFYLLHNDFNLTNIFLNEQKELILIDLDWAGMAPNWLEMESFLDMIFFPRGMVKIELEKFYQKPMLEFLPKIVEIYPELLAFERLEELKILFLRTLIGKLGAKSFQIEAEKAFKLVFEQNFLELLSDEKWEGVEILIEKFKKENLQNKNVQCYEIDEADFEAKLIEFKPKLTILGGSSYPRLINFARLTEIAHKHGSLVLADIAHINGLIASGLHFSPFQSGENANLGADFVTMTTHKTLRGPRGAMIFMKKEWEKTINKTIFPGTSGGPHFNKIAAIGQSCLEILGEDSYPDCVSFEKYSQNVLETCKALENSLAKSGLEIISPTQNHLCLVKLPEKSDSLLIQQKLEKIGIICNRNVLPNDPKSAWRPSGLRLGTAALTSRGLTIEMAKQIGQIIADIVFERETEEYLKKEVESLVQRLNWFY